MNKETWRQSLHTPLQVNEQLEKMLLTSIFPNLVRERDSLFRISKISSNLSDLGAKLCTVTWKKTLPRLPQL